MQNSVDPDQLLHSAAYDLGLYCLPITHLGVTRLKWFDKKEVIVFLNLHEFSFWNTNYRTPDKKILRINIFSFLCENICC